MTTRRPIEELKPTGVRWLETIPQEWELARFKSLFVERVQRSSLEDVHLTPSQKYGVLTQEEYMERTGSRVVLNLTGFENMKHIEPGDFISHLRSFQGGLERSDIPGKVSTAYTVLCPKARVHGPFFRYLMKSDRYIQALRVTTDQLRDGQSIRFRELDKILMPVPSMREQALIADFLDRETKKIDALIEKQGAFIDGLHARRRAVIARAFDELAVGFAPLRRFLTGIRDGTHGSFPRVPPENGVPLLSAKNIQGGRLFVGLDESHISDDDRSAIVANGFPKSGDVLLVVVGATIGKAAVYDFDESYAFQRSVAFLRPSQTLDSKFLWYQTQGRRFQEELWNRANVSAQPGVYLGSVAGVPIKVPSLETQKSVVVFLDEKIAGIDDLIAKSEHLIELSKERRAALITAAVTGQIDVRKMKSGEEAA